MEEQQTQMPAEPATAPAGEDLVRLLAERLRQGYGREAAVSEAVGRGLEPAAAEALVAAVEEEIRRGTITGGAIAGAVIAGGITAVVSAAAWIAILYFTEREVGLLAWAIGGLVGFAVSLASGKRRGRPLQIIAAGWAFAGVALAKGVMYALISMAAEPGQNPLTMTFGIYDLLWFALAVGTAWRMLRPSGLNL